MIKKALATALAASMLLSTPALAASSSDFTDFPNDWSKEAMEHAVNNGLLQGSEGKIMPQGTLTRAQMAAIMTRSFGAEKKASLSQYQDVASDAWYYTELARAVKMGAMKGSSVDSMRPDSAITRQEAFVVIARLFALTGEDASALSKFDDAENVASWAKNEIAALISAGYVNGSDNKLNPTSVITRAEFAQVMDNILASYIDADTELGSVVDGNVIVRSGNKSLSNITINGDLIIGDNISNIDLDNVNVKGRIIIRGGSSNTSITNSTANETIIANPNGTTRLYFYNNDLGKLNVRSSIDFTGSTDSITVDADNVVISGTGSINTVYGNGNNISVKTKGTTVIAGNNSSNVTAGNKAVAPGSSEVVPEYTKPNHDVSSKKLVDEAKIVDLGWSQFLVLDFAKGSSLNDCTVKVDGVDVSSAFTPVSDDASIVKWEVNSLNHVDVEVSNGFDLQEFSINNGKGTAPEVVNAEIPDYFLLNGPVYVWDYHLTNYDDAGNIRVSPSKTTFEIDATSSATEIPSYSPDAVLYNDETALPYFVKGEVQLMFNYAKGTEAEKAFVDGITDVDLVAHNEYKNTLNDELTYEIDKEFVHGDHTVACIKVPLGQVNFTSNGRYNLRVTSGGKSMLFPIHVVNEVVPSMEVTGDTGYSGKEVHFRIKDMTYGITRPIYRVDLTNPAGETYTLAKFDDWFLHGDLLVLYNEHTNYFPVDGDYTVTVYADGFQTFSKEFHQTAFASLSSLDVPFDAISTASVGGGGSSGGDGGDGDSKVMNANLIVDADLMANAKIMVSLGIDNAYAEGISDRWDTMSKLYVFNEGAEKVYEADGYFDAVNAAEAQGEYLTFEEYIASESAIVTPNRPYSVKQVLEDNLLGETTSFREAIGMKAPAFELTEQTESYAVFTCEDKAYLEKLSEEGELFLNTTYPALVSDKYAIDLEAGTLKVKAVKLGANTLKLDVPGYKTVEIDFEIEKILEEVDLKVLNADKLTKGKEIVVKCSGVHENGVCDFMKYINGVKIVAPNGKEDDVMPQGSESLFEENGYTLDKTLNTLTIGKDTLSQKFAQDENKKFIPGEYKIVITAEYYGEKTLTVNVKDEAKPDPGKPEGTLTAPTVKEIKQGGFGSGQYYRVSFNENFANEYLSKISEITLNGAKAKKITSSFWNDTNSYKFSNDPAFGGADKFIDFTTDCFKGEVTVVVKATGYEDLTFNVKDGVLQEAAPEAKAAPTVNMIKPGSMFNPQYKVSFEAYEGITDYLNAVSEITFNGEKAKKVTNLFNETKAFKLSVVSDAQSAFAYDAIDFTTDCFKGEVTVIVKAEGYADLTFSVKDGALKK